MAKMYLIRREQTRFLGPMTRAEFRTGLKTMQFGLQDEVTCHCGTWVVLDNEDMMRKYYSELVAIIAEELPAAWREMTGHARKVTQKDRLSHSSNSKQARPPVPRRSQGYRSTSKAKGKGQVWLGVSLFVATVAVAGGLWLKSREEALPALGEIPNLAAQVDPSAFLNEMGLKLIPVASKVSRGKDSQGIWLPYLRMYAFHTNGALENMSSKMLRGNVAPLAPLDCSVDFWKKKWLEGTQPISDFVLGKALVRTPWTRLLAWDPSWIKRRPMKGWIKPRNWYEGCLMSASVAIRAVSEDVAAGTQAHTVSPEVLVAVSRRIQTQIEVIRSQKSTSPADLVTVTGILSCLDLADSMSVLTSCKRRVIDPNAQQLIDEHAVWQMARLVLQNQAVALDPVFTSEVISGLPKVTAEDFMSKFDFSPEFRLLEELQKNGFKIEGVVDRIANEHTEVRLKP